MKIALITLFLLFFPIYLSAQDTTIIKYFLDVNLKKEKPEKKARYKLISISQEEYLTEKLFEMGSDKFIWLKSYRNNEPFGTWFYLDEKTSKTDSVIYGQNKPQGYYSYDLKNEKLLEDVNGEFSKPKLIGVDENVYSLANQYKTSDINVWISINVKYPLFAHINRIQGMVFTQFTIDEEGKVGHIRITEGVNKVLDIECYRLLNTLPKIEPAKLNGKPIRIYIEVPINFVLQ